MKKFLLTTLLFIAGALVSMAADGLRVHLTDGEPVHFHFDRSPELSFVGGKLQIRTNDAQPVQFELDGIEKLEFADISGIDAPDAAGLRISSDAEGVHFQGIADGAKAMVFTLAGQLVESADCKGGEFTLSRSKHGRGVYIVKINTFTSKIAL